MFTLKQEITDLKDGVLNEDIYVKDGKAFIKNADGEFMFDGTWFVKAGGKWIDLQGGMPPVSNIEFVDNPVFEMLFEKSEKAENN